MQECLCCIAIWDDRQADIMWQANTLHSRLVRFHTAERYDIPAVLHNGSATEVHRQLLRTAYCQLGNWGSPFTRARCLGTSSPQLFHYSDSSICVIDSRPEVCESPCRLRLWTVLWISDVSSSAAHLRHRWNMSLGCSVWSPCRSDASVSFTALIYCVMCTVYGTFRSLKCGSPSSLKVPESDSGPWKSLISPWI